MMPTRRRIVTGVGVILAAPFLAVCRAAASGGPVDLAAMRRRGEGWTDTWLRALGEAEAGTEFIVPAETMMIEAPLAIPVDAVTITGRTGSRLCAAPGSSFEYILSATRRRGIAVRGLAFDANQAARRARQRHRFMGLGLDACQDCTLADIAVTGTLGYRDVPAVAVAIAGEGRGIRIDRVTITACGTLEQPSDGLYISGDDHHAVRISARGVTDTAVVLEACNRSTITGVDVRDSSAAAAVTNITPVPKQGNAITGLVARNLRSAVTGWVQVGVLGNASDLLDTRIEVDLESTGGAGPGINVRSGPRGRVRGLSVAGRIVGTGAQGILVDGDAITIQANVANSRESGIQFRPDASGTVRASQIDGGTFGLLVERGAAVTSSDNSFTDQRFWNVYVENGARAVSARDRFGGAGIDHHGHARHGALSVN